MNGRSGWIYTDPNTKQWGRKIHALAFEFKQAGAQSKVIVITDWTLEEIEEIINAFGYSLYPKKKGFQDITEQYRDYSWIIAECIYEMQFT
jgi:hypothetical protein